MSQKYHGTFDELKNLLKSAGILGEWHSDGKGLQTFRSVGGGILNWWQSTGTIQFQGKPDAMAVLKRSLNLGSSQHSLTSQPDEPETHAWKDQADKPVKAHNSDATSILEISKQALTAAGLTVTQISRSTCIVSNPNSDYYCSVVQRVSK